MSATELPNVYDVVRVAAVEATGLLDSAPEPAFDDLAALAARLLGAPFAFVTLVDAHRSFWKARIGVPDEGAVQNTVQESFCQYVIASGEPLIAGDVTTNPLTAGNPSIESMGVRAWAGFPLLSPDNQSLGSFCVVDTVVREWSETDIATLRVLADAASRELAARTVTVRTERANTQLALLADVGHALGGTLDAAEAVARLARLVVPTLGEWSLVSLVDDRGELQDVSWWHERPELRPVLDRFAGDRLVGMGDVGPSHDAQQTLRPVVVGPGALRMGLDVLTSPQAAEAYRELDPDVYGVWPLTSGEAVHGVLIVARGAGSAPFRPDEVDLAENIAQRAGTVLDNARLYGRQRSVTRQLAQANAQLRRAARHDSDVSRALQAAMLTRLPEPDHLHVAARYLTADSHDQVGGDWYDALIPPGGATTVMIGDVAGHDIAAATVMGQMRNVLRALAWDHDDETPAQVITRLDRGLPDLGLATMTTLVVARVEQSDAAARAGLRTLRWSSAGHPAPVLVAADGTASLLTGRPDPPLATVRCAARTDHVATVGPGATLLMYTDGLIENRTDDLDVRQRALLRVIGSNAGLSLDDLLDTVLSQMVGVDPSDDVALVAVRFHPEDEPRPAEAGPSSD